MKRLLEWDTLELRIDGAKMAAMLREIVAREPMVERFGLRFENGRLLVEGAIRKYILVPFTIEITHLFGRGTTVHVPLAKISAGPLPVPTLLVGLVRDKLPKELVRYEEPATLVVSLDRFLPPFVSADIQKIWIIDGGLAVTLGRGGADLPANPTGGPNE